MLDVRRWMLDIGYAAIDFKKIKEYNKYKFGNYPDWLRSIVLVFNLNN